MTSRVALRAPEPTARRVQSGVQLCACREPTVSVVAVRARLGVARSRGLDPGELLAEAGLCAADLQDPDARVPYHRVQRLILAVLRRLDEPHGLVAADRVPLGALGVLDYVCQNARTLGEALDCTARYSRLVSEAFALVRRSAGDLALIEITLTVPVPPELRIEGLECATSTLVGRALLATGGHWKPLEVQLSYAEPDHAPLYGRFFPCPVRFGCAQTQIVLRAADLELPLAAPDPRLGELMRSVAERQMAELPLVADVLEDVVTATAGLLADGPPPIEAVAGRLGMSTRTLQRRLHEQQVTFQALVDRTRRALALAHLAGRRASSKEVAFLVGFTNSAAFHRAFKRWTGRTPGQWRSERRPPDPEAEPASFVRRRSSAPPGQ